MTRTGLAAVPARILAVFFRVAFVALLATFGVSSQAQAQDVDWLVNIDDAGFDSIAAGGTIEYTVEVTNDGADPAPPTTILISIPATTELSNITGDFSGCMVGGTALSFPLAGPEMVTCNVASLGSQATNSAVLEVLTFLPDTIVLTASLPVAGDGQAGNNLLDEETTVTAGADLGISLVVASTVASGDFIDFDITVLNNGPSPSDSFTIEFPIPTGVTNITGPGGAALPSGCSNSGTVITCNVTGPLANGADVMYSFQGQVSAAGSSSFTSAASILNANPTDPVDSNDSASQSTTTDPGTDVSIDIVQSGGGNLLVGGISTFTISSEYTGEGPNDLRIETTIPAEYDITNILSPDGWDCLEGTGQVVTCTLVGGGTAGANVDLGDIIIQTDVVANGSTSVSADVFLDSAPSDSNVTNNTDSVSATIGTAVVDHEARKLGPNPASGVVGDLFNFRLSSQNIGNADFEGTLQIVDDLPEGLTVVNINDGGWSCTPSVGSGGIVGPAQITCTLDYTAANPLGANERTPTINLRTELVSAPAATTTNSMTVSASNANIIDVNGANDTSDFTLTTATSAASADVLVNKVAASPSVAAGDVQTFFIEVVNLGPAAAQAVTVRDDIEGLINSASGPTDAGFVSLMSTDGLAMSLSCTNEAAGTDGRDVVCTIVELPVCNPGTQALTGITGGTCPVIEIEVRPGGDAGPRTNTVTVASDLTLDPDRTNRLAEATYDVTAQADVTVAKNATPSVVAAGQDVTYIVTATNLSTVAGTTDPLVLSAAADVTITDMLPDDVTFVSATPSQGSCATQPAAGEITSSSQLICNLGTLASGELQTVEIVVRPNNATMNTTILNEVSVTTSTVEIDVTNNAASASVTVNPPVLDISINKSDSVDPVLIGGTTVYVLRVENIGPSASENVVITDILPDAIFAYRSHTISGGVSSCDTVPITQTMPAPAAADRTLECQIDYLPAGGVETINVTMEAVTDGVITNSVSISSDEIVTGNDTEADNNQTQENTTASTDVVTPVTADIAVTSKTASAPVVGLRDSFNWTIVVENNPVTAGLVADAVVLSDSLPTGMVMTGPAMAVIDTGTAGLNACTGAANATSFQCNFGTVSADMTATVTVPVKVIDIMAVGQDFENTATVTTTSAETDAGNNSAEGSVAVNASSLAGTVYRDFDNSATPMADGQDLPGETGIATIAITLLGTAVDGTMINATTTTDSMGNYIFPLLPAGTYTITRGTVNEAGLTTGQNTIGTVGGVLPDMDQITTILLPSVTDGEDYDFAEIPEAPNPAIALVKTASTAFTNPAQVGQLITYSFAITNTGNVELTNVTLTDTVPGVMLVGTPIPSLLPGQTITNAYTATYALQAADIGSSVSNTATVTGTPPTGPAVEDVSGTNTNNDTPTTTNVPNTTFTPAPAISLNKTLNDTALADGAQVGDVLTYGFIITNTGNVTLSNVTVTDDLAGVVLTGSPIPTLNPGETNSTAYTASYTLTAADLTTFQIVNDATVSGISTGGGTPVVTDEDSEVAEFKTIEANPEVFPPFTDGGTTTSILDSDLFNGDPATLDNVTIIVLREDDGVTLDPATGLITLAPGFPAGSYEVDYRICATAMMGVCDQTTETVIQLAAPALETTKMQNLVDNGDGFDGVGDTLIYDITLENTGNIALLNVTLDDTMTDFAGAPVTLTTGPDFVSSSAGSAEGTLAIGETATYRATFVVTEQVVNAEGVRNTIDGRGEPEPIPDVPGIPSEVLDRSDDGIDTDGNTTDDPTEFVFQPAPLTQDGDVSLTKSTTSSVVRRGEAVPYTVTVRNDSNVAAGPFTLVDTLPSGFLYVPGSASLTPTEILPGKITWEGITVPAGGALEVTLAARVLTGARAGDHINTAELLDPATGTPVVPDATATVRLLPEAVFDCGDVIGKVFEDLNGDGYQNAPGRDNGITDQSFAGGKGGKVGAPPPARTERGIPNVRLATVDGSIITTDANGLYSVPCAMLPEDSGSNFILKLDTRSLPSGYRVTTENPRVVRLTPGMLTELNFGAAIGKVVRVDLDGSAFTVTSGGNVALSEPLKRGVAQLLPQIAGEAVNLRLTFHVPQNANADDIKSARAMLRAVDKHIKREWRKVGQTRLLIEQAIARVGQ